MKFKEILKKMLDHPEGREIANLILENNKVTANWKHYLVRLESVEVGNYICVRYFVEEDQYEYEAVHINELENISVIWSK